MRGIRLHKTLAIRALKKIPVSRLQYLVLVTLLSLTVWYYYALPKELFNASYATVVYDRNGTLLGASLARDEQWRFPPGNLISEKFITAIVLYEDEHFFEHPGFNPLALARATWQNIKAGRVVSGGSTLTMQVIRLSRKRGRSLMEKVRELVLATRLELRESKREILALYAAHAPFGGNIVGLDAAAWRYFGRSPEELSWGEATLLAVLPNSPALMHPGRDRKGLKKKRDRLLDKLYARRIIDSLTLQLAKQEPLPDTPHPLPSEAPHLLTRFLNQGNDGTKITSTLDQTLQRKTTRALEYHHRKLRQNEIHNAATMVMEVSSGEVLAYVGNCGTASVEGHGAMVDVISSPRSTGSILKPFLFAAMLDEGLMLPKTLIPDIPLSIKGFAPKNFSKTYDGAVPADRALARSLNVPAVYMLQDYRYEKFHRLLKDLGMNTLYADADHYGLSLILGGAEGTLWDLTGIYASMARSLNYPQLSYTSKKDPIPKCYHPPVLVRDKKPEYKRQGPFGAVAIWQTFEAMRLVRRPTEDLAWEYFSSSKNIAWKTGTSFGHRDAWAIGVTPGYVVGVWVGNADGEGRPGLTGVEVAAPILFDIFRELPSTSWFRPPSAEMEQIMTCAYSGFRASPQCEPLNTILTGRSGRSSGVCPFHRTVHLDTAEQFRVSDQCTSPANMVHKPWFVLPPVMEYYFQSHNTLYRKLPPWKPDCIQVSPHTPMQLIYPKKNARLFIPKELDGSQGKAVFEIAHRYPNTTLFWHLDDKFIGSTKKIHQMALDADVGKHTLTIVDTEGEFLKENFEIISD